jgi:hypothetical protein
MKDKFRFSNVWFLLLSTMALFSISGCIEIIDFDTERTGDQLVVDGRISDSEGPHTLKLRTTKSEGSPAEPLSGADVAIINQDGEREAFIESDNGTYLLMGNTVKGDRGDTYYIDINLSDGSAYRSQPETMPMSTARDSIYYEVGTEEQFNEFGNLVETDVVKLFTDTQIPETGSPLYLRWKLEEAYSFREYDNPAPLAPPPRLCYITQFSNPQQISIFKSTERTARRITRQKLATSTINFSYHRRHYFNAILYSTTSQAYEYWTQIKQVANSGGTIFDVPPATPAGNLYNINDETEKVLGYFEAFITDTTRFFTIRSDFKKFLPDPCERREDRINRPACNNCLEIPQSTTIAPFYWFDDNRPGGRRP